MPVVVMLTLKAKEGQYGALSDFFREILPDTAAREGALLIRAGGNAKTETLTVYEEWDQIESQQAYMGWRTERGDIDRLVALLREPPQVDVMEHLF